MKKMIVAVMMLVAGCADDADYTRALADEGYVDIHLGGMVFFGCGKDDYGVDFTAKRQMPNGSMRPVEGVVCCGIGKACTVRH